MSRQFPLVSVVMGVVVLLLVGCQPQQPFYFMEDGDLSHYKGVATEIEYPDVKAQSLLEAERATRPYSLSPETLESQMQITELTLEEAIHNALSNNKVMRNIGGAVQGPPDFIARNPELAPTIYDPAIVESNPRTGVEAALAAFDTQFHSLARWDRYREPQNTVPFVFVDPATGQLVSLANQIRQEQDGTFQNQLRKTTATGMTVALSHDIIDNMNNNPRNIYPRAYTTQLRAEVRQPLLQGYGVQFNRIAGPGAVAGINNGVVIARINTDIALADFEAAVRNLVSDTENAYWDLYLAYRNLDTAKAGRESALRTWQEVDAKYPETANKLEVSQARQTYFEFRTAAERALVDLYQTEARLRYMMGLATSDGRLFRPKDEPTTAKISFDWSECLAEAITRNIELRENRWIVKKREMDLIAAKNYLMPKLDVLAMYQFQGLGEQLIQSTGGSGDFTQPGSNSYQSLTNGAYQNWTLGGELTVPIGFRREMAGVRNAELSLARQRARLQEAELEVSHQLAFAMRDMESNLVIAQTNFNRRVAARDEVDAAWQVYKQGGAGAATLPSEGGLLGPSRQRMVNLRGTLADVLDAERRLAVAEVNYYTTLVNYAKAIVQVHYRKGSLLEYNGVCLSEGPWPAKAYFDATRRARARDAALYLDYGFTLPKVVSEGPVEQRAGVGLAPSEVGIEEGVPAEAAPAGLAPDGMPQPSPTPAEVPQEPTEAKATDQSGTTAVIRQPQVADSGSAAKAGATKRVVKGYDLGALNLEALGGPPPGQPAVDRARWSPVAPAAYEEPAERGQRDRAAGADAKSSRGKLEWIGPNTTGAAHEPVANLPPAQTDRPASGWRRSEH